MEIDQRLSQELVALNVELTGLAFDQLQCRLVSVDGGRVTSAWTVRALSLAADAGLTVSYVTERELVRLLGDRVLLLNIWVALF